VDVFVEPMADPRGTERALLDGRRAFAACSAIKGPAGLRSRRLVVTETTATGTVDPALDARARRFTGCDACKAVDILAPWAQRGAMLTG